MKASYMKKYQDFELEDFVVDNEFRKWVTCPTESSTSKWNSFISKYPKKKDSIENAALIVRSLEPVENEISPDRINIIWHRIMQNRKRHFFRLNMFAKYAAVFIIAFFLGFGVYNFHRSQLSDYSDIYTEVHVPYGERSQVILYDGTKVWLNSGTTLKFPLVFNSKKRSVFVKGEAFFDVVKNTKKPFIVNAGHMNIQVFGTRFDVCAYTDDHEFSATLEKGKITATNTLTGEKLQLKPGEQAIFDFDAKKNTHKTVDTELYTSWKEDMLHFKHAGFSDVIKKMERWYGVKIIVDNPANFNKCYNMTIKTESLREMLNLLSYTTPMKYKIEEDKVFIYK